MMTESTLQTYRDALIEYGGETPWNRKTNPNRLVLDWVRCNGYRKGNGELWKVQRIPPKLYARLLAYVESRPNMQLNLKSKLVLWTTEGQIELVPDEDV